mmetsp:Transcript_18591/g.38677  ORF Transcript_18591/g.38677 Transcript_18591/m.38677 type:complete len:100 (-) Transcript_18591:118-417(-)
MSRRRLWLDRWMRQPRRRRFCQEQRRWCQRWQRLAPLRGKCPVGLPLPWSLPGDILSAASADHLALESVSVHVMRNGNERDCDVAQQAVLPVLFRTSES